MVRLFDKYEGIGNDFVVVDTDAPMSVEEARRVCDRHFGVGADGVLHVVPADSASARAKMIVINADGSRPEMCGNGLRCVGLHLARMDGLDAADYTIDTDAGPRACSVRRDGDSGRARTSMGQGEFLGEHAVELDGTTRVFDRVSMGNPHAVLVHEGADAETVDRWGPRVSKSIDGGANVEIVEMAGPTECRVIVWERGVGRTLACGTGAAATVVALARRQRFPFDTPVTVHLPGGALELSVARSDQAVVLEGPARRVFGGELAAATG